MSPIDIPTIIAVVFGIFSALVSLIGIYIAWRQLQFAESSLNPWRNVSFGTHPSLQSH